MYISFNRKRNSVYPRLRVAGAKEVHLGNDLSSAIMRLEYTFRVNKYIEQGIATQVDLDRLVMNLCENMKR